jgi:hypothetical protein
MFTRLIDGKLASTADSWSYAAMVLAYRRGGQYASLLQIYGEMRARSMPIYKDVHYAVLEACERLGLWKEGREALQFIHVRCLLGESRSPKWHGIFESCLSGWVGGGV